MMRVCHLDTCPVGIATQNPVLRERFSGKPEFVENFFLFLAEEVRGYLAELGFRSIDEAIGHAEVLDVAPAVHHWKAQGLDLTPVLYVPELPEGASRRGVVAQDHGLDKALDNELITLARPALLEGHEVRAEVAVRNDHRSVGAMLGGEVARRYGGNGLPDDTISFTLRGTGGQSFGAFLPRGVTLRLIGDTNDYVAKGLSGGRVSVRPADEAPFVAEENIIAGNTILYGATAGELYLRGRAGERFAVRNSGAHAVVEGVGDHGCEYMTGGVVVVLGSVGRNFAAGMSGGTAFVLNLDPGKVNPELVDLAPLTGEEQETLHGLLVRHHAETGSAVAERLLKDWPDAAAEFTAVVPRDYKRVMELIKTAEAAGRDVDEAVMGVTRA
jgi:glutamate synthase (NADPH/NADH) large chain